MNLICCNHCGVILNKDKLKFAEDIHDDDGAIRTDLADYNQDSKSWQPFVKCPVCQEQVFNGRSY